MGKNKKLEKKLIELYRERFTDTDRKLGIYSAPGRVNLIGEHTDYNNGFVLPVAIEKKIYMLGQLRVDRNVSVYSLDLGGCKEFNLDNLEFDENHMWSNYLMGVIDELKKGGFQLQGANLIFTGDIPRGAGLSSSAALEVATAFTLTELNDIQIGPIRMAEICQRAENNFVGVQCGIMDQYISRLGQREHALLIDCQSYDYQLIPFKSDKYRIVICDSKVQRGLVDSRYNERRQECEEGVKFFADRLTREINSLRDVSLNDFHEYVSELPENIAARIRHVLTENRRVLNSVEALQNNKFERFGQLMKESHKSLQNDYQVSCQELDLLVELAIAQAGVAGARMTGAGFGGCTVNLVEKDKVPALKEKIVAEYRNETGIIPDIYLTVPAGGVETLREGKKI